MLISLDKLQLGARRAEQILKHTMHSSIMPHGCPCNTADLSCDCKLKLLRTSQAALAGALYTSTSNPAFLSRSHPGQLR